MTPEAWAWVAARVEATMTNMAVLVRAQRDGPIEFSGPGVTGVELQLQFSVNMLVFRDSILMRSH
jgi:hypothetical protein